MGDDRQSAARRGYDRKWQRLRVVYARKHPLCEHCESRGITQPMAHVDHITPITGPADPNRLRWDNLQSLCRDCHQRKTFGAAQGCDADGRPTDPQHWWNR